MASRNEFTSWRPVLAITVVAVIALVAVAAATGAWLLSALAVGIVFGFCLQRGDLCSASAFSEVLLMRDGRKVAAIWLLITVSMLAFGLLEAAGLVQLRPKPLLWASQLVGGLVFGAGMVLAGGCISGSLYKVGTGNLNSMASLAGIPIGIGAVLAGPLAGMHAALRSHEVKAAGGGPVTFSSVTGVPFWLLAVIIGVVTLAAVIASRRRARLARDARGIMDGPSPSTVSRLERIATRPWRPWQAGLAIGVLAGPAYLSSVASGRNYPLGVTKGVWNALQLMIDRQASVVWWLVLVVIGLVLGSWVAALLSGQARLLPKPPEQVVIAFGGGMLVGVGAALAGGCYVGNIMSGIALMSVGMLVFTAATVAASWAMTWLYLMGGWQR